MLALCAGGFAVTTLVGINIVIAAVLGVLALLCGAASASLGRNAPLAWIAAALTNGTVQTLIITFAPGTPLEFLSAAVLAPLGFLLAAQSIEALVPGLGWRWWVVGTVALLSVLSVSLQLLGAPFLLVAVAFELACVVAMADAAWRVGQRPKSPSKLLLALTGAVYALLAVTVIRMAMLPVHIAPDLTFATFTQSNAEALFLGGASALTPIAIILLLARIITETIDTFQYQSQRDGLTGLFNRRAFDSMTAHAGAAGAVIFCDIDHFKRVNDRFGHEAGDVVICDFAELIGSVGHTAGRIGGEEFALLLPGASAITAAGVAEDIRLRFNDMRHEVLPPGEGLSASFGVADYSADEPARRAFARADAALYAAKAAGRNRVKIYRPDDPAISLGPKQSRHAA